MKVLSLFSNIGVAEARLEELNFKVAIANEIDKRRADLYKEIYPETVMIHGDIRNKEIKNNIIEKSLEENIEIILATPPCQGMSTAGKKILYDERNYLIVDVIEVIERIEPRYVFIENVKSFLDTPLLLENEIITIKDFIHSKLSDKYHITHKLLNTQDFGVPQSRLRNISLLTIKNESKIWKFPERVQKKVTLKDVIGDLPSLDPYVKDVSENELLKLFPDYYKKKKKGEEVSVWHKPPIHIYRQVIAMMYTPTGKSAFENSDIHKPRKEDRSIVRGYKNTYKRQSWDMPAYTVTMDNRKISSQNNVHPGNFVGIDKEGYRIYSDPRCLSLYEIFLVSTIPENWNIPEKVSEAYLRSIIGEGIPPLFVNHIFKKLR